MLRVSMVTRKMKTPEVATPGFSIPFWEGVSAFYDFFFSYIH